MKFVWVGIGLLLSTVSLGVGCGPKEKYCYLEKEPCSQRAGEIKLDGMYEAPEEAVEDGPGCISQTTGLPIPCSD
jgi:hypothetical protein